MLTTTTLIVPISKISELEIIFHRERLSMIYGNSAGGPGLCRFRTGLIGEADETVHLSSAGDEAYLRVTQGQAIRQNFIWNYEKKSIKKNG